MADNHHITMSEGEARRDCKILGDLLNSLCDRMHTFDKHTRIELQHARSETNKPYE